MVCTSREGQNCFREINRICYPSETTNPEAVSSYYALSVPVSLWKPINLKNGYWSFQNVNTGKFLARCQGCVKGTWPVQDMAFAHIGPGYDCAYWKVASVCA